MIKQPELNLGSYTIGTVEPADVTALLNACGAAYEKHHNGNDNIGWKELGDTLFWAIKRVVSSKVFEQWQIDCDKTRVTASE